LGVAGVMRQGCSPPADDASSLTVHFFSFFFSSIRKHVDVENAKTQVEKRKCAKCPTCERCAARFNLKRVAGKKGSKREKKASFLTTSDYAKPSSTLTGPRCQPIGDYVVCTSRRSLSHACTHAACIFSGARILPLLLAEVA